MVLTLVTLLTLETLTMNEVTQLVRDSFRLNVNIIHHLKYHVSELKCETSLIDNNIDWALENALLCHFFISGACIFHTRKASVSPKS